MVSAYGADLMVENYWRKMSKSIVFELEMAENGIIWRSGDFVSVAKDDEATQFIGSELIS